MKDDYLIVLGEWSDGLHCPTRARDPGGVPLGSIPLEGDLVFLALFFILLSFHLLLAMIFVDLTVISFLDIFANKNHVALRLSYTNIQALNYLLRLEIFVSEDGQLRAAHLVLDYEHLSCIFQDVGQAIRAGSSRLAQIDVSKLGFLARKDLPPIVLPVAQNLPPIELPLPQILPEAAAIPKEEIVFSRLSLEEEIDKFHFEEENNLRAPLINISDAEGESDRNSSVHTLILVIARSNNSFDEEEDSMALNKGNKSLRELMAARGKESTSKAAPKSKVPPPPP